MSDTVRSPLRKGRMVFPNQTRFPTVCVLDGVNKYRADWCGFKRVYVQIYTTSLEQSYHTGARGSEWCTRLRTGLSQVKTNADLLSLRENIDLVGHYFTTK